MISIIICSINNELYRQVSKSIAETITNEYELIKIDNVINNFGICRAYNEGAKRAKFPYLCFLHEDIRFRSFNWDMELVKFFEQDTHTGIIGVAGSKYKSKVPSIWAQGLYGIDYANLIQHYRNNIAMNAENNNEKFSEVKTLDGVFLFTKKEIWARHNFDEFNFDKFHCYDLDFSLQVGQQYKLYVSNDILIEHFSSGNLNKDWVHYSIKLSEKWQHVLPICIGNIPYAHKREIEWRNRKIFFFRMNILGYPILMSIKIFFKWDFMKNTSLVNLIKFTYQIIGQKLNLLDKKQFY